MHGFFVTFGDIPLVTVDPFELLRIACLLPPDQSTFYSHLLTTFVSPLIIFGILLLLLAVGRLLGRLTGAARTRSPHASYSYQAVAAVGESSNVATGTARVAARGYIAAVVEVIVGSTPLWHCTIWMLLIMYVLPHRPISYHLTSSCPLLPTYRTDIPPPHTPG